MTRRHLIWAAHPLALLVGLSWGYSPAPSGTSAATVTAPDAPTDCASVCQQRVRARRQRIVTRARNSESAALVSHLDDLLRKSGYAAEDGVPTPWPDELGEAFKPEAFKAKVEELMRRCPEVFGPDTRADCSEYPCMVLTIWEGDERNFRDGVEACEARQLYGVAKMRTRLLRTGLAYKNKRVAVWTPGESKEHERAWSGNLRKRNWERWSDYVGHVEAVHAEPLCDQDDGRACFVMATRISGDVERQAELYDKACTLRDAEGCNNFAWQRCHDLDQCDDDALDAARRSLDLRDDERGYRWDTLAYTLCQMNRFDEANEAYATSCQMGYLDNCTKRCP